MITERSAQTLALLSTQRARALLTALESGKRSAAELAAAGIDYSVASRTLSALVVAGLVAVPDAGSVAVRLERATITIAARLAEIGAEVAP